MEHPAPCTFPKLLSKIPYESILVKSVVLEDCGPRIRCFEIFYNIIDHFYQLLIDLEHPRTLYPCQIDRNMKIKIRWKRKGAWCRVFQSSVRTQNIRIELFKTPKIIQKLALRTKITMQTVLWLGLPKQNGSGVWGGKWVWSLKGSSSHVFLT